MLIPEKNKYSGILVNISRALLLDTDTGKKHGRYKKERNF
jgi:hypothetical protein